MKLNKLHQLIDEAFNKPKKDDCGCTGGDAPILTESKVKDLLSEGLQYHLDKKVPLHNTIYRYGSEKHLLLVREARKMYSRGVITLSEDDKQLVSTNLGEFALYEGESVPLDLPMVNEATVNYDFSKEELIRVIKQLKRGASTEIGMIKAFEKALGRELTDDEIRGFKLDESFSGFLRNPEDPDSEKSEPTGSVAQFKEKLESLFGKFKNDLRNPEFIRGVAEIMINWKSLLRSQLDENKKKKDPPIGKPKRGGSKAYYVYVRDPKTKRIKKVSFGSGGLRAKIKDSKARSAFAKRHRCSEKNDRTKPSYWSCRLPRYAQALGLGSNSNTFW